MPNDIRLALIIGLVAFAGVIGAVWRLRTGRARAIASGELINLAELAAIKDGKPVTKFGKRVTFLQFSSEVCSACRQTARVFADLEKSSDDVLHVEVDITNRLDLAKKFNILQTPTTLVLDQNGRVTSRIGGAPKQETIDDQLGLFEI